jgi:salicylate hydroxylase
MRDLKVTIAGAGIAGLTTALALQRAGHRVRVLEQAPSLGEVGAGVMLSPNATRVLFKLGLGAAIAAPSVKPAYTAVRDYRDGRELSRASLQSSSDGMPFYYIHRADLHEILTKAVYANDPATVILSSPYSEELQLDCDLLVGADGIKSKVRSLVAEEVPTRFTGNVAWRGLVPMELLRPESRAPESIVWVGPGKHVVRYGVRNGTIMNYVALIEQKEWQEESWNTRADIRDILSVFVDWHPEVMDILEKTPKHSCYKWGLFDRDPLPRLAKGRAVLVGDAAHPMLPFMAQGAAMSIEDAGALTTLLGHHTTIEVALAAYDAERLPRTSWVQQQSRRNQQLYHDGKSGTEFDEDREVRRTQLYEYNAFLPGLA